MVGVVVLGVAAAALVVLADLVQARTQVPAAVLLVLAGLVYGLLPGRNVEINAEVVLTLVLPPLLYWAALNAGLLEIRANLYPVFSLAVSLVLLTALAAGAALAWVVPGLPLAVGVALGAAVAPPDPIAALSIGRRAGLPARLITLIEGEGLLNDATAITALQVAIAVAVGGGFSLGGAAGQFVYAAVVGTASGLVVATVVRWLRRFLPDPLADNGLSLMTPFLPYLLAEEVHGSGLLAVVVAGLWLGYAAPVFQSASSRLQTRAVWRLVNFLLEGVVFLLIGDQLPAVVRGLHEYPAGVVAAAAALTVAVVLLIRPAWLALIAHLPRPVAGGRFAVRLNWRELLAMSWVGTRGVISLAAAFAMPAAAAGRYRPLLLFCAYAVVLVTVVGQGSTFAPLVRALGLTAGRDAELRRVDEARVAGVRAGLRRLDELERERPVPAEVAEGLRRVAGLRCQRTSRRGAGGVAETPAALHAELRRQMIEAERDELVHWRDAGRLSDPALRLLERELDQEEGLLAR
ncbi:MAG TPA: Na+/H+ antiporter [Thermomicrobiales bacterium]|nr:Na+/H+ antiporter [Thermomicrobiales bacterium]